MATKNSSNLVYLVLNVTQGVHFDCWRKIRLRIASTLEKQMMVSHHFYVTGEPLFNMYFVWCMTEGHFKLLQSLKTDVRIGIVAEQSGETWIIGCVGLGIQHAQLHTPHIELHSRQLQLVVINAPKGTGLQPELAVTLTIQSKLPEDSHAEMHLTHLTEPPEAEQPGCSTNNLTDSILKSDAAPSTSKGVKKEDSSESDVAPSTSKSMKQEDSSEFKPSLKPNEWKQSNLSETNTNLVYVVLNVTQGVHFDCWRKMRLRIASCLERQMLVSHSLYGIGEPIFNMYFVWCMTELHLQLLQTSKTEILIGVVVEQSRETQTTGCAGLGIQHAQLHTPDIELHSRQLDVKVFKRERPALQPELTVTLTIQSKLPEDKRAEIHVAHLTEPPEAKQDLECIINSLTGSVLESDAAPSTSANVNREDSPERKPSLKPKERTQSNLSETNTNKETKNVRFQDEL